MRLLRVLVAATAAELGLAGAALGLIGLLGVRSGWCDVATHFAPCWLAVSLLGAIMTWAALAGVDGRLPVLLIALVGVVANAALTAPEYLRAIPIARRAPSARPLTIVTFNVWEKNIDPDRTVDVILRQNADIVALQEATGLEGAARARLLAAYPYQAPGPCCLLALLSKQPWVETRPAGPSSSTLLGVTKAPDGGTVAVVTTHLPWPVPPGEQSDDRATLTRLIAGSQRPDLVVVGDFNLTPWSWSLRTLDQAFRPLSRRERALFTYPANIARLDRPSPLPLLPIDHVYAGPAWRTVQVDRLPRAGSDHDGVRAVLVRAPAEG
jgi:endonuclease/exonuclease/phosphatase (EEP) superfamily protein YafD